MLEVVLTDGRKITAYVGDSVKGQQIRTMGHLVGFVFADGDEYSHIRKTFDGLPLNTRVDQAFYYGDFAKFIAGNWTWF